MFKFIISLIASILFINSFSAPLPFRTEILLNDKWDFTPKDGKKTSIMVPDFWDAAGFEGVDQAIYERQITIPLTKEWQNKIIKIEFEGVNFIADVFINSKLITSHIGGWIPFSVDITDYVKPGETYTLKVDVKGGSHQPIVDKKGYPQWPVGFIGQKQRWGIVFDVWLRSYGKVCIEDAFIQTSYRKKSIAIEYTVNNYSETEKSIVINGEIAPEYYPNKFDIKFESERINLKPGESKIIVVKKSWNSAHLWSPDDPFLYYLTSSVSETGNDDIIDIEKRRFGFREIWTSGNKLMFNGHRFTILGTNIVQHSEFHKDQRYFYMSPESWNESIDRLFELNLRTVRFHMQPAPKYIIDIADERGLLVMDESTIYAREYILKANKKLYLENCKKWIESWVKARRNHPSIIVWNAENEMGVGWLNWMTSDEMKSLGDEIRKYDTTRLVNYDGDRDVGDQMINYHYIETYKGTVDTSIYSWADSVKSKPTGVGEFITHYGENGEENQWWMGTFIRGMRYVNFADIRPYRHDWAWLRSDMTPKIENLKNSLSPVALFDKNYDDLGIGPLLYDNHPVVQAGDTINSTLILYNDEFSDTVITIEVLIKSSEYHQALYHYHGYKTPKQKIVSQGMKTYFVPLGEHIDIPYSYEVPAMKEGFIDFIDVELVARKKGKIKFKETIRYAVRNFKFKGETSNIVTLKESQESDY
ncbi:glycoside hydrolase family 2 protein [Bacteroidota bacterium]